VYVWRVCTLTLSDPMSDLIRHYDFPVPDAFLNLYPFPIQFFCHPHTPQLLFILGGKDGGLLVIILVLKEKNRNSTTCTVCWLKFVLHEEKHMEQENHNVGRSPVPDAFPHVVRTLANK
jgi:hypothetical protein